MMTRDEFTEEYAKYSGVTVPWLLRFMVILPCSCDYEKCQGWKTVTKASLLCDHDHILASKEDVLEALQWESDRCRCP